jgi:LysR family transcriptional regulator, cell division regulator
MMGMNVADLNLFATVARHGSITKAARTLNTVQSNVTTRLRSLEDELGVSLFQRHHRGVTLTRPGQDLLPYAHQMDVLLQKAREAVSVNQTIRGALRLGSMETTAAARLPALLRAYVPAHRHVDLAIETGITRVLIQAVLEYRLDGAFVAGPVELDELEQTLTFVEELVLVSSPQHKSVASALQEGRIPKAFVFRVGCSYRQKLERFLSERGLSLVNQLEMGTLEGILGCVSADLGITMMPFSVVEPYVRRQEVAIHRLAPGEARVQTVFITRRDLVKSPALEEFIGMLREQGKGGGGNGSLKAHRNGQRRGRASA